MYLFTDYLAMIGEREKWQMTSIEVKIFSFDWRLCFAFVPVIFFMFSPTAYLVSLSIVAFCQFLKYRGMSLPTLIRTIEYRIQGRKALANYRYEKVPYRF